MHGGLVLHKNSETFVCLRENVSEVLDLSVGEHLWDTRINWFLFHYDLL